MKVLATPLNEIDGAIEATPGHCQTPGTSSGTSHCKYPIWLPRQIPTGRNDKPLASSPNAARFSTLPPADLASRLRSYFLALGPGLGDGRRLRRFKSHYSAVLGDLSNCFPELGLVTDDVVVGQWEAKWRSWDEWPIEKLLQLVLALQIVFDVSVQSIDADSAVEVGQEVVDDKERSHGNFHRAHPVVRAR